MPHSLRAKLKGLNYKKILTDRELERLCKALDNENVLEQIRDEIEEEVLESLSDGGDDWFAAEKVNECLEIIAKYKGE